MSKEQTGKETADARKVLPKDMYGHVLLTDYTRACKEMKERALRTGGDTEVNYLPHQNGIIIRGTSMIKKSSVLKSDPKAIMEDAIGFELVVVGVGPHVKGIEIGDAIDIKSSQGLSLRPFIPHPNNVTVWRKKLKTDRDSMIRHTMGNAEDASKVGSGAAVNTLGIVDSKGGEVKGMIDVEEEIEIVEHFGTEDHNVAAVYKPLTYVREGK